MLGVLTTSVQRRITDGYGHRQCAWCGKMAICESKCANAECDRRLAPVHSFLVLLISVDARLSRFGIRAQNVAGGYTSMYIATRRPVHWAHKKGGRP